MAQHHLRFLLLCLQTWLTATGKDADLFMNGILGESVAFPLNIQNSKEVQSIAWTSESSVAVITPGDSGKAPTIIVTHNNYKGRIKVIQKNYDLVISDLKMEDAGKYKADITINSTTTKIYYLHVFRRLGKPKITQSLMTSMNGTCNVTLTCSVEKEEKNVSYSWNSLETESNVLQVIQTPGNQGLNYTCTAQNPVSNNSSSISSQQLCADITTDSHTHHTGLLSGLAIIFLAVLILPAVLLCHLRKRKQDAASENIIYTCAKVSKDTQPAEAKIYDEISQSKVSPSKDESLKTIYSTVQYPAGICIKPWHISWDLLLTLTIFEDPWYLASTILTATCRCSRLFTGMECIFPRNRILRQTEMFRFCKTCIKIEVLGADRAL